MPRSIIDLFWRAAFDIAFILAFDGAMHALFAGKKGKERIQNFIRNRRNPTNKLVFAALYGIFSTFGIKNTLKVMREIKTSKPPFWLRRNKNRGKK